MPLVYKEQMTDLVGCIVGLKNTNFFKNKIVNNSKIIGFSSNGPHTNGFSLINKIDNIDNSIANTLLNPHTCYLSLVKELVEKYGYDFILGMAHITGGGLIENISRVIPDNLNLKITNTLPLPEWCQYLSKKLSLSKQEMLNVYNCGIGFVLIIEPQFIHKINKTEFNYIDLGIIVENQQVILQ